MSDAERAAAAYAAMQQHFYVRDGNSLYRLSAPLQPGKGYAFVWEFSRALVATLALAGMPGVDYGSAVKDRLGGLTSYWNGRSRPPAYDSYVIWNGGGDQYHDDNVWIALALVQHYRMGLTNSLDRARQLFTFARSGWDAKLGGVYWVKQGTGYGRSNHDRGIGATAGNAELGYHLCQLTGAAEYAADADSMADWVNTVADISRGGAGPFQNAVRVDGSIDTNLWSYNQGVMIGANVLRAQVSGSETYLAQAEAVAESALRTFGDFRGQPPPFNAMLFQNLLMLYPHANSQLQERMLDALHTYADWAWETRSAHDPRTDLFYFDDAGRPVGGTGQPAQLRDQGAMTQLYALLAWSPADYSKLT